MAGLLNANLPSSDEEDDDYNPLADDTAEREDRPAQAQQPKRRSNKRRRGAVASEEDADGGGDDEDGDGEAMEEDGDDGADAEADANDPRTLARREKVSNLWEAINVRAAANGSATDRPPSSSTVLAALCHSTSGLGPRAKKASSDEIWMRSLGLLPKRGGGAGAAKKPPASKPQTTADAVPAAAAAAGGGSVSAQANGHKAAAAAEEAGGAGGEGAAGRGMSPRSGEGGEEAEGRRAIAAAALAAARDAVAAGGRINKVVVKKVRRFAGKDVEVIMHVDKDSKEAQRAAAKEAAKAAAPLAASAGGLDAVLSEFEKKKKVTVLDKTRADWSEYKATNTEVEEELELHKRSGAQFLEKQNFLKRAELREYEKERDTRLASDVRTRGRL